MQKGGQKYENGNKVGNDVTSNKAIREALTYAVDRNMLVEGVLNGHGTASTTGLEKMPWLNKETVIDEKQDIEKAKRFYKMVDGKILTTMELLIKMELKQSLNYFIQMENIDRN